MKKIKILIVAFIVVISQQIYSQQTAEVGMGLYNPTSYDGSPFLGFNASFKHSLDDRIRIGVNIGYYFNSVEPSKPNIRESLFTLPVTGLIEVSILEGEISPYVGANVGTYITGVSSNHVDYSQSDNLFGFSPTLGAYYTLTETMLVNFSIKYHSHYRKVGGNRNSFNALGADLSLHIKL